MVSANHRKARVDFTYILDNLRNTLTVSIFYFIRNDLLCGPAWGGGTLSVASSPSVCPFVLAVPPIFSKQESHIETSNLVETKHSVG